MKMDAADWFFDRGRSLVGSLLFETNRNLPKMNDPYRPLSTTVHFRRPLSFSRDHFIKFFFSKLVYIQKNNFIQIKVICMINQIYSESTR